MQTTHHPSIIGVQTEGRQFRQRLDRTSPRTARATTRGRHTVAWLQAAETQRPGRQRANDDIIEIIDGRTERGSASAHQFDSLSADHAGAHRDPRAHALLLPPAPRGVFRPAQSRGTRVSLQNWRRAFDDEVAIPPLPRQGKGD